MRRVPAAAVLTTTLTSLVLVAGIAASGTAGATDGTAGSPGTAGLVSEAAAPSATASPTPTPIPTATPSTTAPTPTSSPSPTATSTAKTGNGGQKSGGGGGKAKAPDKYTPRDGAKFNNPVGTPTKKGVLRNQLIRTINSVPKGEEIRVASWNIRSPDITRALIAASNRGVSVQAVMDRLNAKPGNNNVGVNQMVGAFKATKKRPKDRRSSVVKCLSSCRSTSGIAHTKFYLFSKAGKATDVVMFGSNNATDLAAFYQWNDLYTVIDNPTMYAEFEAVFAQMRKDKPYKQPYLSFEHPEASLTTYFYPFRGEVLPPGDPVLDELDKVQCTGATGGTGTGGNTKIRIAQTSMHSARGLAIAKKLRELWQAGCDVKVVYAVFGNNVLKILRSTTRGAVPIRQIAQDFDLDGVYDRYLHLKDLAISGVYDGNTAAEVTFNGSANYTSVALASDEIVAKIVSPSITQKYAKWVDTLYANPPRYRGRMSTLATMARMSALSRGISPESGIEEN